MDRLIAFAAVLLQAFAAGAPAACLDDPVPAAERKDILLDGLRTPLGVWPLVWDSATAVAHVMAILAEERLGYNVSFGPGGAYSYTAINALVGCDDPGDTDGCLQNPPTVPTTWHLSLETWGNAEPVFVQWRDTKRQLTPRRIGNMGYMGGEGSFIRPETMAEAMEAEGMPLDWFRNYNATWGDPAKYFDPIWSISSDSLVRCLERMSAVFLEEYHTHFQYGVALEDGSYVPKCPENGVWWLSPACKHDDSLCLPYVADPDDYNTGTIMQQAVHWNMPVAIATATSKDAYKDIVRNHRVMMYRFFPDSLFSGLDLRQAMFPPHSFSEWEQGLKVTNHDTAILSKWAAAGLEHAAPEAFAVASKFAFPLGDMNSMLASLAAGLTHREAACEWLKANENRWSPWLPDLTAADCHVGQGLVDAQGRTISDPSAAIGCEWCAPGRASAVAGNRHRWCAECAAGEFQAKPGQAGCDACPPGKFSDQPGQTACLDCPVGQFTDGEGNSECAVCTQAHETTPYRGALSKWECVCAKGHYRPPAHSVAEGRHEPCYSCPEGMECAMGNDLPILLAGYWASSYDAAQGNFSVYICRDALECPGGPAGTCAPGREGVGCANCMSGYSVGEHGACNACTGASTLPLVLAALGALVAMMLLAVYARRDVAKMQMNTVVVGIVIGQTVMVMQIFSVLEQISVIWMDPFASLLKAFSALGFAYLGDLKCMFSDTQVVTQYLFKQLVFPGCIAVLCIIFFGMRMLGRDIRFNHAFNSIGLLTMIMFLTLVLTAVKPFYCTRSPNGLMTWQTNPSVICFDGETWTWLAVLGTMAVLVYGVGVFSWTVHTTMKFPRLISSGRGSTMMNRYRFLFQRFTVECYYYGPVYLARSLLIVLIPIIFPHHGHRQVFFLALVVAAFGFFQTWIRPWRGFLPNLLDMVVAACTVMIALCAAFLVDVDKDVMQDDVKFFLMGTTCIVVGMVVTIVAVLFKQRIFPSRDFAAFLCHHKVGCAAGARLMKLELERRLTDPVFLDSDALDDLEDLLNIVRVSIRCLVVLLTSQTLSRPWCAGEIVTAYLNSVPMIPVRYDDYVELEDEDLTETQIGLRWPVEAFSGCAAAGVTLTNVKMAYAHLRELEKIPCLRVASCICGDPQAPSREAADSVLRRVLRSKYSGRIGSLIIRGTARSNTLALIGDTKASVAVDLAVVADCTNAEAISTAAVLSHLVRKQTQWVTKDLLCSGDVDLLVASGTEPEHMVVVFTDGALISEGFSKTLLTAFDAWGERVLIMPVMMERFVFPTGEALKTSIVPQVSRALSRDEAEVAGVYGRLISVLAAPFSPSSKISVLKVEVANIVHRLEKRSTNVSRVRTDLTRPSPLLPCERAPGHEISSDLTRLSPLIPCERAPSHKISL